MRWTSCFIFYYTQFGIESSHVVILFSKLDNLLFKVDKSLCIFIKISVKLSRLFLGFSLENDELDIRHDRSDFLKSDNTWFIPTLSSRIRNLFKAIVSFDSVDWAEIKNK